MGGLIFLFIGLLFTIFFKTYSSFLIFIFISFPSFLIGIIFLERGRKEFKDKGILKNKIKTKK